MAVWLRGRAGRNGVSEGAGGLSQGPGGYSSRPPGRRHPRGAGRRVWEGEPVGRPPGWRGGSPVGVTGSLWIAASGWMTQGGWDGVCAENLGVREQWNRRPMRSPTHTRAHTHAPSPSRGGPTGGHPRTPELGCAQASLRTNLQAGQVPYGLRPQFSYLLSGSNTNHYGCTSSHSRGTDFLPHIVLGMLRRSSFTP